ncbi:hypothetical protein BHE74_00051193 [Ensete ventricosum]|nr:hypothetical protein BHE74_00051193 [Ensete ventricosum]
MALVDRIDDAGWVISIVDNKAKGLRKEIADLRVRSGLEAVAAAEQRASEAQALVDHLRVELKEVGQH